MRKTVLLPFLAVATFGHAQVFTSGLETWQGDTLPTDWFGVKTNLEYDSIAQVSANVHGGSFAVQLINRENNTRRFSTQPLSVDSAQSYDVSFWVRGSGEVRVSMFDGRQENSGYAATGPYTTVNGDTWTQVTGSVVCAVILANTGYLGVPLVSALLDHDEIANAVAWDALVSNVMLYLPAFAVGAAFGTTAGESPRERTVSFFTRNPVIYAVVLGFLLPESVSPDALFDIAKFVAGFGVLPLGFFLLGVNLMEEKGELGERSAFPALSKPIALVCGLRLVVAPALLAILVVVLAVDVPDAFYLQAAMPSGINTLVVAHVFGLDLRTAAGAIAWSTMFAVLGAVGLSFVL